MRDLIEACAPLIYDSVTELGISEEDISNPVSYTHLTLPTTPYV